MTDIPMAPNTPLGFPEHWSFVDHQSQEAACFVRLDDVMKEENPAERNMLDIPQVGHTPLNSPQCKPADFLKKIYSTGSTPHVSPKVKPTESREFQKHIPAIDLTDLTLSRMDSLKFEL
jgi:hypothetical protein